ncbi:ISC system 2Fe-2S type ferredoxin [Pseudoduganella sp. GCM10020061]|uniref:ISC system 2Fe-2S type ferredoxin n=1 Tax=Pseudoduganella sp. GCM10020061 TaxID=3317345 RepID=UPI003637FC23
MSKVTVLPHPELAPNGAEFEADDSANLCQQLLDHDVDLEHACGMVGACTTCHVIVQHGFDTLPEASDKEEDMLDRAWGVTPHSRLSCQITPGDEDLVVALPRYTVNLARE